MTRLKGEYLRLFELFGSNSPFTDTQYDGYMVLSWNNGSTMYLSQGGGTYIQTLNSKNVQFIAGNDDLLQTGDGLLTMTGTGWCGLLFMPVEPGKKVVFTQNGSVIDKTVSGKITISSMVKGARLFAKLLRCNEIVDVRTDENGGYSS